MITLYGIPNCNTVKNAKNWLSQNAIVYQFHDFKKQGINTQLLATWCQQFTWQKVLNTKGLTYKKLSETEKEQISSQATAITYMLQATSSIKRPILETPKGTLLGFDEAQYHQLFIKFL